MATYRRKYVSVIYALHMHIYDPNIKMKYLLDEHFFSDRTRSNDHNLIEICRDLIVISCVITQVFME